MKKMNVFSLAMTGLLILQFALVACEKPKQREETIDQSIKENLVQISDLHDMTSESTTAYFYKENSNGEIALADKNTKQLKADENVMRVLSMIKKEETKKSLDEHMSSGLIAFAVLADQVKIFKVLTKAQATDDKQAHSTLSLLEIKKMKKDSLETKDQKMVAAQINLEELKSEIEFIEIASVKIAKSGVLENKRTKYYDEKTSILTIGERPLEVSTHLLLEAETTSDESAKK